MGVLYRKSWQDIRRRWARSVLTIATIAAAVAGLGLFALPALMDRAMKSQIADDQLHDIRIFTQDIVLDAADREALLSLPGVETIEWRTVYFTQVRRGDRREDALLVGVEDFGDQQVNVVQLTSGEIPGPGQGLTDVQNARTGRLVIKAGEVVEAEDNTRATHPIAVSGVGRTLQYSQLAIEDAVVLYLPQATVNEIAGSSGTSSIEVRVSDQQQAQVVTTAIQDWLIEHHPDVVFTNLPDTREAGTWPGQDVFDNFSTLFYVGAVLALISAVALISNTMTTMVAEQRREIAIMKAIGGRRLQIGMAFLRTVALLGLAGSVLGVIVGIPFANFLARFVGNEFLAVSPDWGVSWPVVALSIAVGVAGTTLAALPALVHGIRMPIQAGLSAGSLGTPGRASQVVRLLPLPRTASMGLRNVTRRKTRAIGTVVQVGLAVGVSLGLLALGVTVGRLTADTWDTLKWDVIVGQKSNVALDARAGAILEDLDGVSVAQPVLYNTLKVGDQQVETWGMNEEVQLYEPDLSSGRWLSSADNQAQARVAVIGNALARTKGLKVGDTLAATSARGPVELTVVGIDRRLMNNGQSLFVPLATLQEILGRSDSNAYWLVADARDEPAIDRIAADAEDRLAEAGYPVATEIRYVERAANLASNRTLVRVLSAMGIPIAAIGLIGLLNMMTMNVIERTREIGVLRCIGAGSRDITRVFRAEALAVAGLGWLAAVPLGWLIGRALVEIVARLFDFGSVPYYFPGWYVPIALVATLALAWVVVIPPLRRASHLHPGDALRYE